MNQVKKTGKKIWARGEKADVIAAIAEAHLKVTLTASIKDLCTVVQREISRKKLDIELTPSVLRGIVTADKRDFCFVRIKGMGMHLTSETGLMSDIMQRIKKMQEETAAQKIELSSSNVRYLHTAPRTSHEEIGVAKRA
jgi:hypothetical protein